MFAVPASQLLPMKGANDESNQHDDDSSTYSGSDLPAHDVRSATAVPLQGRTAGRLLRCGPRHDVSAAQGSEADQVRLVSTWGKSVPRGPLTRLGDLLASERMHQDGLRHRSGRMGVTGDLWARLRDAVGHWILGPAHPITGVQVEDQSIRRALQPARVRWHLERGYDS
jgi:hypothetical protein